MMISALYYESLITKMMEQVPSVEWSFQDGLVFTPCDATYPNLYFMFKTKWLEVNPKDYLFPVTEDGTMCIFFIMPVNLPMNILGMPLYVDYYTIHDPVTGTIGWAPHTSSLKESVVSGTIPSKDQFLTVGEAATPQDGSSLLISWAVTALIVYLFLDWWGQFTRPQWEESLDSEQFIIMTVLFFAATFLAAIYLVQPLVYSFIHSQLSGTASASAMAAPRVAKNVLSLKTVDFIVYGLVLGLVSGLVLKKLFFRGVKPAKSAKKTASKSNATATDISTLLA